MTNCCKKPIGIQKRKRNRNRNTEKGGELLMSIIPPNFKHSFIRPFPVPVPVHVPVPDSGSGFRFRIPVPDSGSGFRFRIPVPDSGSGFRFRFSRFSIRPKLVSQNANYDVKAPCYCYYDTTRYITYLHQVLLTRIRKTKI